MASVQESEAFRNLKGLFAKYKEFCFRGASQIPYGSMNAWVAFADGRVEEALKEKRSLIQSIKDAYTLGALGIFFSIIAFWYVVLLLGGMMLTAAGFVALLGLFVDALLTVAIIAALLFVFLAAPALFLLARGAIFHAVAKLLGARGSYSDTVSVLVLTSAANIILMIPLYLAYALIIGFMLGPLAYAIIIYAIYLQYRGMRLVHDMSSKNAALATIGGFLLEMALYGGAYIALYLGAFALSFMT